MALSQKIDFLGIIIAENCNPNGDPLNDNRPRVDFEGRGEMTPECLKRKIRNRLQDAGEEIFVQSNSYNVDKFKSLEERFKDFAGGKIPKENGEEWRKKACGKWIDVRAFGQIFPFKGASASINVRGPVSITFARTIDTITLREVQITKSTNTTGNSDEKDSATMGINHIIDKGVYVFTGGIFPQLAELTGFTDEDAEKIKQAIINIFINDASAARPNGSMTLANLYWWRHKSKFGDCPPVTLYQSLNIHPAERFPYYTVEMKPSAIDPEIYSAL